MLLKLKTTAFTIERPLKIRGLEAPNSTHALDRAKRPLEPGKSTWVRTDGKLGRVSVCVSPEAILR
jgi:hypothetical protein